MKYLLQYIKYMRFSSIKLIIYVIIKKIFRINNSNFKTKISNVKTGNNKIVIRPFTTDINLINNLLLKNGEYDFIYKQKFEYIKNAKNIIDAGAYIGIFSRMISEITNDATIIAIEPEDNNYDILQRNLNNEKYICKKNGLWNKNCKLVVHESETGEWGFTVEETKSNKYDTLGISIIDIMKEYNMDTIDILKMDIEGSEYYVFDDSCEKWIDKVKMIIIEFHDRKIPWCTLKVMEQLKKHHFDEITYGGENYIFYKKDVIENDK